MANENPEQAKRLFREAVERPGPERSMCLDSACGQDTPLREQVEASLAPLERARRSRLLAV